MRHTQAEKAVLPMTDACRIGVRGLGWCIYRSAGGASDDELRGERVCFTDPKVLL